MGSLGVYAIRNTVTGHVYVGSSLNVAKRFAAHRLALRRGTHECRALQRDWTKYGEKCFTFEVLERVSVATLERLLRQREEIWLRRTGAKDPARSYNASASARPAFEKGRVPTPVERAIYAETQRKRAGWKHRSGSKEKIVEALRVRMSSRAERERVGAMNRGKPVPDERRGRVALHHPNRKLKRAQVDAIRAALKEGATQAALARQYGVSQALISAIKVGRKWRWHAPG